jgi:hypothetical protein
MTKSQDRANARRKRAHAKGKNPYERKPDEGLSRNFRMRKQYLRTHAKIDERVEQLRKQGVANPRQVVQAQMKLAEMALEMERPSARGLVSPVEKQRANGKCTLQALGVVKKGKAVVAKVAELESTEDAETELMLTPAKRAALSNAQRKAMQRQRERAEKKEKGLRTRGQLLLYQKYKSYLSWADLRDDAYIRNKINGMERAPKGTGYQEAETLAALHLANEETSHGMCHLSTLSLDMNHYGFKKSIKTCIENIVKDHVITNPNKRLLQRWVSKRAERLLEIPIKLGADGLPMIDSTAESWTQASMQVLGAADIDDSNTSENDESDASSRKRKLIGNLCHGKKQCLVPPGDLSRTVGLAQHNEQSPATAAMIQAIAKEAADLAIPWQYGDWMIGVPFCISTVDWSMQEKPLFRNCFGAASDFVGGEFEGLQRAQWVEKLSGVSPLDLQPMTWERRVELGAKAEEYVQQYMATFQRDNHPCGTCAECKSTLRGKKKRQIRECKKFKTERSNIKRAYCEMQGHAQKGKPSELARHMLHCSLHAACRLAPTDARAMIALSEQILDEIANDPVLRRMAEQLQAAMEASGAASVNVKGNHATHFYSHAIEYLVEGLDGSCTYPQLLLMARGVCIALTRNLLHLVRSTHCHSAQSIGRLGELGKRLMTLTLRMHGAEGTQPYVYAIGTELPAQVKALQDMCVARTGIGLDTTSLSAQDSEHNGYVIKMVEHNLSEHKTVHPTGIEHALDMKNFHGDRCIRPFVVDTVTKSWKYRLGIARNGQQKKQSKKLIQENRCEWCACEQSSATHRAFCEHPLFAHVLAFSGGADVPLITQLLKSQEARDTVTSAPVKVAAEKQKTKRADQTIAQSNKQRKATKAAKAKVPEPRQRM